MRAKPSSLRRHPLVFRNRVGTTPADRSCCSTGSRPDYNGIIIALLFIALIAFTLVSCATDTRSLERYQAQYKAATNVVAQVRPYVEVLPPPVSTSAELLLGLISGGLAAWNGWQHTAIRKLKRASDAQTASAVPYPPPARPSSQGT